MNIRVHTTNSWAPARPPTRSLPLDAPWLVETPLFLSTILHCVMMTRHALFASSVIVSRCALTIVHSQWRRMRTDLLGVTSHPSWLTKVENSRHLPINIDRRSAVAPELGHADVTRARVKMQAATSRSCDGIVSPCQKGWQMYQQTNKIM